jgi:acyl carrier protein
MLAAAIDVVASRASVYPSASSQVSNVPEPAQLAQIGRRSFMRKGRAAMDRKEITQVLLDLLEEETDEKYEHLSDSANLRVDLDLDSVDMVSLVLQIENRLNIEIEGAELEDVEEVGQLLDLLEAKVSRGNQAKAA